MTIASISDIFQGKLQFGEQVTVRGWVRSRRDSKAGLSFLHVHDGTCFDPIQAVVTKELANYESEVLHLTAGCSVIVTGKLVLSQGKAQAQEIQAESVAVVGWVEDPETYPIQPKKHTFEYLRTVAHLRPRTNAFSPITPVRTTLMHAIYTDFYEREFRWINTPFVTPSDCAGAGELFRLRSGDVVNLPKDHKGNISFRQVFFGKEPFLTLSGQL